MILSQTQTEALDFLEDSETTEVQFGGGAGGGKSIVGNYWILKGAMKYPGSRWLIGRNTLKTLRETTLVSFFNVARMQGLQNKVHYTYIAPSTIRIYNGSEILLKDLAYYPADPEFDELGSLEITGAFIDEAQQVTLKAKNVVRSRIRYMLDEFDLLPKSLYACNPGKNWTKQQFWLPWSKGELPTERKFVQSLVDDNEFISKHYKANLKALDQKTRERLLYGNWNYDDDPDALMTSEVIQNIFNNKTIFGNGKRYITADIARFGKDKTVIRVWDGWYSMERHVLRKKSLVETADFIRQRAQAYSIPTMNILVDEDGVGGGVVDILRCKGFINNSRPLPLPNNDNFDSLKSQCAFFFAQKARNGHIREDSNDELEELISEELSWLKQKPVDKEGKRSIISKEVVKEHIGRSPDDSDCLIMRAWFDLKPEAISIVR